jgi:hypothetical protein
LPQETRARPRPSIGIRRRAGKDPVGEHPDGGPKPDANGHPDEVGEHVERIGLAGGHEILGEFKAESKGGHRQGGPKGGAWRLEGGERQACQRPIGNQVNDLVYVEFPGGADMGHQRQHRDGTGKGHPQACGDMAKGGGDRKDG